MSDYVEDLIRKQLTRRDLLKGAVKGAAGGSLLLAAGPLLAACSSAAATPSAALATTAVTGSGAAKPPKLVLVIRDLLQENSRRIADGGQQFAGLVNLPLNPIVYNNDENLQLSAIKAVIAEPYTNCMNWWPNTNASTATIAPLMQAAGGYMVTQWNKPPDLHPWDVGNSYVAHITFDDYTAHYTLGKALFNKMGGTGGWVAIQGLLDADNAQQSYKGIMAAAAEFPNVKQLAQDTGKWDRTTAYNLTQT